MWAAEVAFFKCSAGSLTKYSGKYLNNEGFPVY